MARGVKLGVLVGAWGCGCLLLACSGEGHRLGGEMAAPATGGGGDDATGGTSSGGTQIPVSSGGDSGAGATGEPPTNSGGTPQITDEGARPDGCEVPGGWEDATVLDGMITFEPLEIYTGYVVNPAFPLPEDDDGVTLFVETRSDTAITGAIMFGDDPLPAPATDPIHGYLPEEHYSFQSNEWADPLPLPDVWSGHALSLQQGIIDGPRVQFAAHSTEQWRTWCELLMGYSSGYCAPDDGCSLVGEPCDDQTMTCDMQFCGLDGIVFDPWKANMCSYVHLCSCEGCGCTASLERGELNFDLRDEGNGELNGTLSTRAPVGDVDWQVYLTLTSLPECDPPYTVDTNGIKKFKPECL